MSSFDRPLDWPTCAGTPDHAASSGRWSDAVHALQQAAALKPGDATIARNLGAALANVGRSDEALVAYEAGSAIDRISTRGRLDYAQLLINLGRRNDAMTEV